MVAIVSFKETTGHGRVGFSMGGHSLVGFGFGLGWVGLGLGLGWARGKCTPLILWNIPVQEHATIHPSFIL